MVQSVLIGFDIHILTLYVLNYDFLQYVYPLLFLKSRMCCKIGFKMDFRSCFIYSHVWPALNRCGDERLTGEWVSVDVLWPKRFRSPSGPLNLKGGAFLEGLRDEVKISFKRGPENHFSPQTFLPSGFFLQRMALRSTTLCWINAS